MSTPGIRITSRVIGTAEVAAKLHRVGGVVHTALVQIITRLGMELMAYVKEDKLSGQVLNVRTGRLRRSINLKVYGGAEGDGRSVYASVGTNVEYAAIHELGGRTKPHVIEARRAQALAFVIGGELVFRKRVNHPGSNMPERSFLRSALADKRAYILEQLEAGVQKAAREA